jgi:tetratricopeptide (TPR) repeat protein
MNRPLHAAALTCLALALPAGAQVDYNTPPPGQSVYFENLGAYHKRISSSQPQCEAYFDQGLRFIYAFNLEEAQRSFEQARKFDTLSGICYWGEALALGPNINLPPDPDRNAAAYRASRMALSLTNGRTGWERDLAEAVAKRYSQTLPTDKVGQHALDQAYADAMKGVAQKYADDPDIQTLYAESLMDLRPWDLWTHDGKPQPGTEEIIAVLEKVLLAHPDHPGANHYYIHAVEASPNPERGLAAATRLPSLMHGAGHITHMPSHIYVRTGRYEDAAEANRQAITADQTYLSLLAQRESPAPMLYGMYIAHNHQFLSFAAMMEGRSGEAVRAAKDTVAVTPEDLLRLMPDFDSVLAMPLLMEARFGQWDKVLAANPMPAGMAFPEAMRHYARGLAFNAQNNADDAKKELGAVRAAIEATPEDTRKFMNPARLLLGICRDVLAGEVSLTEGKTDEGLELLRKAVAAEDTVGYDEPPDWYTPTRHALGAALLKAGKAAEAEKVYQDDLTHNPENGWALFGLVQSLKAQSKDTAAAEQRLKKAWANADMQLTTTWY